MPPQTSGGLNAKERTRFARGRLGSLGFISQERAGPAQNEPWRIIELGILRPIFSIGIGAGPPPKDDLGANTLIRARPPQPSTGLGLEGGIAAPVEWPSGDWGKGNAWTGEPKTNPG